MSKYAPLKLPVPFQKAHRIMFTPQEIFDFAWNTLKAEMGSKQFQFPSRILWLNGAPGAGKGTHTPLIIKKLGINSSPFEMSSLFHSPEAKNIMAAGGLIDDKTATSLLFHQLLHPEYKDGVVVDGYPRTAPQGEVLKLLAQKLGPASKFQIMALIIDEEESIRRQLYRGNKDKEAGKTPRETDQNPELARKRYRVFMEQTYHALQDLSAFFPFFSVTTNGTIEEIGAKISAVLQ